VGLFSSGKDKAAEALKWPVTKIKDKSMEKYYKAKSKVRKGTCPECGNPISKDGYIHNKCVRAAKSNVESWVSSHQVRNTNHCQTCGTNFNTTHKWNRPDCCKNVD